MDLVKKIRILGDFSKEERRECNLKEREEEGIEELAEEE